MGAGAGGALLAWFSAAINGCGVPGAGIGVSAGAIGLLADGGNDGLTGSTWVGGDEGGVGDVGGDGGTGFEGGGGTVAATGIVLRKYQF